MRLIDVTSLSTQQFIFGRPVETISVIAGTLKMEKGKCGTRKCGTKMRGWKIQDWKMREKEKYGTTQVSYNIIIGYISHLTRNYNSEISSEFLTSGK